MEKRTEDSTPSVDVDQCDFSQVIFNSVEKSYVPGRDVTCFYTLTQQFIPHQKDWIGIFKVGWKTIRDYYTFMWVTLPKDQDDETSKCQEILFKAYYLPKDDEYYQFCYVDQDGVIRGASRPFQFREENEDTLIVTSENLVEEIEQQNKTLCKENQELRESHANLQKLNSDLEAELKKKQKMLHTLNDINKKLEQKVTEQDSWKTEVLGLKQQNEKLALENEMMGGQAAELQDAVVNLENDIRVLSNEGEELKETCANLQKLNSDIKSELQTKQELMKNLEEENKELEKQIRELNENSVKLSSFMCEQVHSLQNDLDIQKLKSENLKRILGEKDRIWKEEVLGLKQQNEKLASEKEMMGGQVAELQGRLEKHMEENRELFKENVQLADSHANLQKLNWDLESEVQKKQGLLGDKEQQHEELCKEYEKLKDRYAQLLKVNSDMTSEQMITERKMDELKRNNSLLKDENTKLLFYVNKYGNSVPSTFLNQEQETSKLVYGNPYCGIQDISAANLIDFQPGFAEESSGHTEELRQQEQNLHLVCEVCQETFPQEEKQVFDDHVFCHSLSD